MKTVVSLKTHSRTLGWLGLVLALPLAGLACTSEPAGGDDFAADESHGQALTASGQLRAAVFLVNFPFNTAQTMTVAQAQAVMVQANNFFVENSFGLTSLSADVY